MLEVEEVAPIIEGGDETDTRRALLGEIVQVAGRASKSSSGPGTKGRRSSEAPRKSRSQTMSSPNLTAPPSPARAEDELTPSVEKSPQRHKDLKKSESVRRKSIKVHQVDTPALQVETPPPMSGGESELGQSEEDSDVSGSDSLHTRSGSSGKPKRTSLLQALRNTAATKKRHSVAVIGAEESQDSSGSANQDGPIPGLPEPKLSELVRLRIELQPEVKARPLLNLDQEKDLFGDLLWRNNQTLVLMLRSLTTAESHVRSYINRLSTFCSDLISGNRVGVILVAYGHASAAQVLRKSLPFGYLVTIDKRRRLYDSLGCLRLPTVEIKIPEVQQADSSPPRTSSLESIPDTGSLTASTSAFANTFQLGGVFGFVKHKLVCQYVEGTRDDQGDVEKVLRALLEYRSGSASPQTPSLENTSASDGIAPSQSGPALDSISHREHRLALSANDIDIGPRRSKSEGRKKSSSNRELVKARLTAGGDEVDCQEPIL